MGTYEVTTDTGTYEVTTDEGSPLESGSTPPSQGWGDTLANTAGSFFTGAAKGAGGLAEMGQFITNPTQGIGNYLAGMPKQESLPGQIQELANTYNVPQLEPGLGRNVAEFAGAGAIPLGEGSSLINIAKNAFIGGLSGVGQTMGEKIAPTNPYVQGAMALGVPVVGSLLTHAPGAAWRGIGPQFEGAAENAIQPDLVAMGVTPGLRPNGFRSTAELTGNPTMAALQKELAQTTEPGKAIFAEQLGNRSAANIEALQSIAPEATPISALNENVQSNLDNFISSLESKTQGVNDELQGRIRAGQEQLASVPEASFGESIDPQSFGSQSQTQLAINAARSEANYNKLYKSIDRSVEFSTDSAKKNLFEMAKTRFTKLAPLSDSPRVNKLWQTFNSSPRINSFNELDSLRKKAFTVAQTEQGAARDFANAIGGEIENTIQNPKAARTATANDVAQINAAKEAFKAHKETFGRGAVGQIVTPGEFGVAPETSTFGSKVLSTPEDLTRFQKALKAKDVSETGILSFIKPQITNNDGTLNLNSAQGLAKRLKNKGVFASHPEVESAFNKAITTTEEYKGMIKEQEQSILENIKTKDKAITSKTRELKNFLPDSNLEPEKALQSLLRKPRSYVTTFMRGLTSEGRAAVRKGTYDLIVKTALDSTDPLLQNIDVKKKLVSLFTKDSVINPHNLKAALGAKGMNVIKAVSEDLVSQSNLDTIANRISRGGPSTATVLSAPISRAMGRSPGALTKLWNTLPAGTRGRAATAIGGAAGLGALAGNVPLALTAVGGFLAKQALSSRSKDIVQGVLAKALANPEYAAQIAGKSVPSVASMGQAATRAIPFGAMGLIGRQNSQNQTQSQVPQETSAMIEDKPLPQATEPMATEAPTPAQEMSSINPLVKAVAWQESRSNLDTGKLNQSAKSRVGAHGVMQLMPTTAKEIAMELGEEYDPNDPNQNIRFGSYYLDKQLKRFGDVRLALAAYNAGPGRVSRWVNAYGNDYDTIMSKVKGFSETKDYVTKIMKNYSGMVEV